MSCCIIFNYKSSQHKQNPCFELSASIESPMCEWIPIYGNMLYNDDQYSTLTVPVDIRSCTCYLGPD